MKIYRWQKGVGKNWRHLVKAGDIHVTVSICNPNKWGRRKKMILLWVKHQFGVKK